jgi:hypothetical protein
VKSRCYRVDSAFFPFTPRVVPESEIPSRIGSALPETLGMNGAYA